MKGILYPCYSKLPYTFSLDSQNKKLTKYHTRINARISTFGKISLKCDIGYFFGNLSGKFKIG